jgi:hypothetical protein
MQEDKYKSCCIVTEREPHTQNLPEQVGGSLSKKIVWESVHWEQTVMKETALEGPLLWQCTQKTIQDLLLIFFEFKFDATRQEMQWELCIVFAVAFLFKVSILILREYYFDLVPNDYPSLPEASTSSLLFLCPLGSVFEMSLAYSTQPIITLKVGDVLHVVRVLFGVNAWIGLRSLRRNV